METPRIIPAKNGGWLTAGNPGNKGGGCTPLSVRQAALEETADAIPILRAIVQGGEDYAPMEKIAATGTLHRISGPDIKVITQVDGSYAISTLAAIAELEDKGMEEAAEIVRRHALAYAASVDPESVAGVAGVLCEESVRQA